MSDSDSTRAEGHHQRSFKTFPRSIRLRDDVKDMDYGRKFYAAAIEQYDVYASAAYPISSRRFKSIFSK